MSTSSRASTPSNNDEAPSPTQHTSVSIYPQEDRLSLNVLCYKSGSEPPCLQVEGTSIESDHDDNYEDVPYDDREELADMVSEPEKPPAKQSCTTNKATFVSPYFKLSCPILTIFEAKRSTRRFC